MAFKDNPHFQARLKEGGAGGEYTGDGPGGFGAGEGKGADIMDFGGADVMMFDRESKN